MPAQLEPHHPRDQHRHGLAQHRGLGLNAAHAPTENTEPVDHGGVRVGSDAGVGVGLAHAADLTHHHYARQALNIHLVHDARARWHHRELVEGALAPAQELVALAVARVLEVDIERERVGRAEEVGDDRVVDDKLSRGERIDEVGVATEVAHGLAHRGKVDDARHAGEVLHNHACGRELNLLGGLGVGRPRSECANLVGRHIGAVFGAQQVLEQHPVRIRQRVRTLDRIDAENHQVTAAYGEGVTGSERVDAGHDSSTRKVSRYRDTQPTTEVSGVRAKTARHSTCCVVGKRSKARSDVIVQPRAARAATSRPREAGPHDT
ncbi:unannotated protein [freshwater metagenome]|uniref:Unannotated protein n=1 Tax=freshwater metagenome TaxID=449393 RepID=A0A6J7NZH7_9ZZZZ